MSDEAVDAAAARLYALPLDQFTAARDELARALRKDGRRGEADGVRALRKPTSPAWALNQLAHRRRRDVEELLAAGSELRAAQEQLLRGGGREALDAARARERDLTERFSQDAATMAGEGGVAVTPALLERIRGTLHAALLDEEVARELAAGRLVREHQAIGFPEFAVSPAPAKPKAAESKGETQTTGARADRRRAEADRKRAEELRGRLKEAAAEHRELARRLQAATRQADRARARADDALERLRDAEAERDALSADVDSAADAVRRLETELGGREE